MTPGTEGAHHGHRVSCGNDGTKQKRFPPVPVVGEHELIEHRHQRGVDGDARERHGEDGVEIAEEGMPVQRGS